MGKVQKKFGIPLLCVVIGIGLLVSDAKILGGEDALRLLAVDEMRRATLGAAPSPCLTAMVTGNCIDYMAYCANNANKADCEKAAKDNKKCTSCDNKDAYEQDCMTLKPWNAFTCQQEPNIVFGCGEFINNSKCTWNQTKCECEGGTKSGTGCDQHQAVSTGVGICEVQK